MCVGENRRTQHYAGNNPCLARSSSPRVLALPLLVWCPAVKSHYPFSLKPQASSSLGVTAEARWAAQAAFFQIRRNGMDNKPFYWKKKKTNQRNGKTLTRATVCPQHRGVAALLSWVLFSWWNALSEGLMMTGCCLLLESSCGCNTFCIRSQTGNMRWRPLFGSFKDDFELNGFVLKYILFSYSF